VVATRGMGGWVLCTPVAAVELIPRALPPNTLPPPLPLRTRSFPATRPTAGSASSASTQIPTYASVCAHTRVRLDAGGGGGLGCVGAVQKRWGRGRGREGDGYWSSRHATSMHITNQTTTTTH